MRPQRSARRMASGYQALLPKVVGRLRVGLPVAAVLLIAAVAAVPLVGDRPLSPTLQERDLLVAWETSPGTSSPEMNRITAALTGELRKVPGIRNVGAHSGRALASDQVVNINSGQVWLSIDPAADYSSTLTAVRDVVGGYPGVRSDVVTYTDKRAREVQTRSVSEDLVVRVYGNDYGVLNAKAQEVLGMIRGVEGVVEPRVNSTQVAPTVEIEVSVDKAAKYGLKPGDVRRQSATLVAATIAGNLFQDQKVFEVVVWGVPQVRRDLTTISALMIDAPIGGEGGGPTQVRLSDVADVRIVPRPEMIWHDQVSRSLDVVAKVQGRGLGAVTADVQNLTRGVTFPREHHLEVLTDAQAQAKQRNSGLAVCGSGRHRDLLPAPSRVRKLAAGVGDLPASPGGPVGRCGRRGSRRSVAVPGRPLGTGRCARRRGPRQRPAGETVPGACGNRSCARPCSRAARCAGTVPACGHRAPGRRPGAAAAGT